MHEIVHDRAMQQFEELRTLGLADHDVGDVVVARIGDDIVGDTPAGARRRHGFASEPVGEAERVGDAVALDVAEGQTAPALDRERDPGRAQTIGEAFGVADETRAARVLADAHHH